MAMPDIGRPEHTDEQFQTWLNEMAPFLKVGYSLHFAIEKAMLFRHKDSIYRKYKLNDWFCEKIDVYQKYTGEIVNSVFTRLVMVAEDKLKQGKDLNNEEWRNLRFLAQKHRSCQPFFVSRQEIAIPQAEPDKIGLIIEELNEEGRRDDEKRFWEGVAKEVENRKNAIEKQVEEEMKKLQTPTSLKG